MIKEKASDKSWQQVVQFHQPLLKRIQELVDEAAKAGEYVLPYDSKSEEESKIISTYFREQGYTCGSEKMSGSSVFMKDTKKIKWLGKYQEYHHGYYGYQKEEEKKEPTEESKTWELVKSFHKEHIKKIKDGIYDEATKGHFCLMVKMDDVELATIMTKVFQEDGYSVKLESHWFPFLWNYTALTVKWLGSK